MKAMVIFSDGRTTRYGGEQGDDRAAVAREVLEECTLADEVQPVRLEIVGLPWVMWVAAASLDPADQRWMPNIQAAILPTQVTDGSAPPTVMHGPVVITAHEGTEMDAAEWDRLDEMVDEIVRALHSLPVRSQSEGWAEMVRMAGVVISTMRRPKTLRRVGG